MTNEIKEILDVSDIMELLETTSKKEFYRLTMDNELVVRLYNYITNLQELYDKALTDLVHESHTRMELQEEIERLNNTINELEIWAYELEGKILCNDSLCIKVEDFLDKLKELKEKQQVNLR